MRKPLALALIVWFVILSAAALPVHAAPLEFNIHAGPAPQTLLAFINQSNLDVLYERNEVASHYTQAVSGPLEPLEALRRMLEKSGLRYDVVAEQSVVIRPQTPANRPPQAASSAAAEQVEVIATWFRGQIDPPIGANVTRITQTDIQLSGAQSLPDLLRTLPQVSGMGPTENTHNFGREAQSNSAFGQGINLRGLGAGATLVLVDGHPLAPSGTIGGFVDISDIPLAAVDHVEILGDGGSIVYGPDAIGGIVNIILRKGQGTTLEARAGGRSGELVGERGLHLAHAEHWTGGQFTVALATDNSNALWAAQRPQATSDLRAFGGTDFDTLAGNPGTVLAGGQTWAIPHNQDGTRLIPTDFIAGTSNQYDLLTNTMLHPAEALQSVMANGSQHIGNDWTVFLDALASRRTIRDQQAAETTTLTVTPQNPFYVNPAGGGLEMVEYGFQNDLGPLKLSSAVDKGQFSAGADYAGRGGWQGEAYGGCALETQHQTQLNLVNYAALAQELASSNPNQAFNPFGDGSHSSPAAVAAIRATGQFDLRSSIAFATLTAQGPVLHLPGGDLTLKLGTEAREQSFNTQTRSLSNGTYLEDDLSRSIWAAFAQSEVGLIGERNALPGLRNLAISTGVRYERYTDTGGITTPQFGLSATPLEGVTLRATWTRLFKAPNLGDLSESGNVSEIVPLPDPDPHSKTGYLNVLALAGNNADLRPETARSWTLGLNLSSRSHPGGSLALTYFHTRYYDLVEQSPDLSATALSDPTFQPYISRNVSDQERQSLCKQGQFLGPASDCLQAPVAAIIDLRLHNRAVIQTSGLDLNARLPFDTRLGTWTAGLLGTYLLDYSEAPTSFSPLTRLLDTEHNPISVRLRAAASWKRGSFTLATFANYQGNYTDIESVPARHVSSWTTVDATLKWEPEHLHFRGLKGTGVQLSVLNLLNRYPPFLNNVYERVGYDEENGDLTGREASLTLRVQW
jgi:iron complex outermembrane recepter protein